MKRLFEKIKIGSLELKNRIAMSAMDLGFTTNGRVNDRLIDFYRERAKGGVGLIVVGGCYPELNGKVWKSIISLENDEFIPDLRRLTDAVHKHKARIAAQILHAGRDALSFFTKMQPVAPSNVTGRLSKEVPHVLTQAEIKKVIEGYASASLRAKKAGFDAIEIHGGMGYLINQFLSPITNKRKDRYGGTLQKRINFAREVIIAVKKKVGREFPIIFRIPGDDLVAGSNRIEENIIIAKELEKVGVDAFNVSPGWHESTTPIMLMAIPRMPYIFLAESIKQNTSVPVIGSIRINNLSLAEEIIANEQADLISLGRPLIADPEMPNKYRLGKVEDIRTCIACNQGCFDNVLKLRPVSCLYNAQAGKEGEYKIRLAKQKKKVLVIGGGPAGMEAARVAALRGHSVTLYEKDDKLGGQLKYAWIPPGREEFQNVINFLETQIKKIGVKINLQNKADIRTIVSENPDALVIAVGSKPIIPDISGIEGKNVCLAQDVLNGTAEVGKDVVIIGGGTVGCETALHIARMGAMSPEVAMFLLRHNVLDKRTVIKHVTRGQKNITVLEMKPRIGGGFGPSTRWVILKEMEEAGVKSLTNVKVKEIESGSRESGITIERNGKKQFIKADTVVIAVGYVPDKKLDSQLNGRIPEVYAVGDCVNVRTAFEAVHEGFESGLKI